MKRKEISKKEALSIRGGGNPKRAIAPDAHIEDLINKPYVKLVETFKERIYSRYIDAAEYVDKNGDYNFVVTVICFVVLDLLSQYVYGVPSSSPDIFKQFFRDYFKEYNQNINPPIKSCFYSYKEKKWFEETINDVADGIYHCFRCGVVHSGMILEYGRINKLYKDEVITIKEWDKGKQEINVNSSLLLLKIKEKFNDYIQSLKDNDPILKQNFKKKLQFDWGLNVSE